MKLNVDERLKLIKEVGEEILTEDELVNRLIEKETLTAYDGFEPSGRIHIAQGLLRAINVNKLIKAGVHFKFLVADWYALMNNKMGGDLSKIKTVGEYFIEVWKVCGMDMKNVEFIWASDLMNDQAYWLMVLQIGRLNTVPRITRCSQIMGRTENDNLTAAQIFYPCMQASDIFMLNVDIAQLGMDQRKVNVLAREVAEKIGRRKPIAIHHHMLMGLTEPKDKELTGVDATIAKKMSKSNPDSAIFMTDSKEEIERKFKKAYCPEGIVQDNPVLEYCKYIIFEKIDEFAVKRSEKFGGDVIYKSYEDLEKDFVDKKLHPMDLKATSAQYINQFIEPVREHFKKNVNAKELLEKVESFQVTR